MIWISPEPTLPVAPPLPIDNLIRSFPPPPIVVVPLYEFALVSSIVPARDEVPFALRCALRFPVPEIVPATVSVQSVELVALTVVRLRSPPSVIADERT